MGYQRYPKMGNYAPICIPGTKWLHSTLRYVQLSTRFPCKPRLSRSKTGTILSQESEISSQKEVIASQEAVMQDPQSKLRTAVARSVQAADDLAQIVVDIKNMR